MERKHIAIHWFRKGLRLHDNPALIEAISSSTKVYPIFVIDPWFIKPNIIGVNRFSFLLQCLHDLDTNLRLLGSRLYVIRGKPEDQLPVLFDKWNINLLTYEKDSEPYARRRDEQINNICRGDIPSISREDSQENAYNIPTLQELGYSETVTTPYVGGETEALKRLQSHVLDRAQWVGKFEKPSTSPNSLEPSTTVLSPYLKFGCLSSARFYNELLTIYSSLSTHSSPPVSLHGQLLWREFFYLSSYTTINFDKMEGNAKCRQIPWSRDFDIIEKWKLGQTGYPFIDAIMTQLRIEGWIHHLARHMVACFLTRGDLWQHWEEGVKVFDLYLLDDDWALNNANWQWLSCSNFFYQYFRCYSPVAFGKKTDPDGNYIRKYIPQLASFPSKYIYEPWKAPLAIQQQYGCIIGRDYYTPIVDHDIASKANMNKMKDAYSKYSKVDKEDSNDVTISTSTSSISTSSNKKQKTEQSNKITKYYK
eukprot:gene17095-22608_t